MEPVIVAFSLNLFRHIIIFIRVLAQLVTLTLRNRYALDKALRLSLLAHSKMRIHAS